MGPSTWATTTQGVLTFLRLALLPRLGFAVAVAPLSAARVAPWISGTFSLDAAAIRPAAVREGESTSSAASIAAAGLARTHTKLRVGSDLDQILRTPAHIYILLLG